MQTSVTVNKLIEKYDKSNMYRYLKYFYEQISTVEEIFTEGSRLQPLCLNIAYDKENYSNIVVCGMGGSSIGGEFVKNIIDDTLDIPFIINNNYCLPNFVSKDTLLIIVSYSGNTEEMISCYNESKEKNIKPYILTSGGYLLKEAKAHNLNFIKIPEDYPPRVAFGFMSISLLKLLIKIKLISNSINKEIELAAKCIDDSSIYFSDYRNLRDNIYNINSCADMKDGCLHPFLLAKDLFERKPEIFIYTTPKTKTIGYRFKCQLAENAKILSNLNSVPEMNHNEIEGYKNADSQNNFILWLSDSHDLDENIKDINNSYEIINNKNSGSLQSYRFKLKNLNFISEQYLSVYYLDWVSYYLALLYKLDPTPVELIQELKSMS